MAKIMDTKSSDSNLEAYLPGSFADGFRNIQPIEFWQPNEMMRQQIQLLTQQLAKTTKELNKKQKELLDYKKQVEELNHELVETNEALSILARHLNREKDNAEKKLSLAIKTKVMPIINKNLSAALSPKFKEDLCFISAAINDLIPEINHVPGTIFSLTPSELHIANMIKEGVKTPQIAASLFISEDTVKTHRKNIRKKLNLQNSNVNLKTYLKAKLDQN